MKLNKRILGEGKPLIVLHGLFGSSDNWQTLGRKFSEDFKVVLVDQRNHGKSGWSDEFNYDLLADDLLELIEDEGLESPNILGHSMGGKTAMMTAIKYPGKINKLIVGDIGPKAYPMHHDLILRGLHAIDLDEVSSRREAEEQMKPHIKEFGVRQFLLKNLYWKEKGQLGWRINIPVLEEKMPEILKAMPEKSTDIPTLFIRGDQSNYILERDFEQIQSQFNNAQIETLEDTGHWIHAESPKEFYRLVMNFLQ